MTGNTFFGFHLHCGKVKLFIFFIIMGIIYLIYCLIFILPQYFFYFRLLRLFKDSINDFNCSPIDPTLVSLKIEFELETIL